MLSKKFKDYIKKLNLFKISRKPLDVVLVVLMILFIIIPVPVPIKLAELVDTFFGSLVILMVIVSLFMLVNPIVGLLGLIVGYMLIYRSSLATGSDILRVHDVKGKQELPKLDEYKEVKHEHGRLEEEAVSSVPSHRINTELLDSPYKELLSSEEEYESVSADSF